MYLWFLLTSRTKTQILQALGQMESHAAEAAFGHGDWDSFNRLFFIEEIDFPHQILHQLSFSMEHDDGDGGLSFMNQSAFCYPEANISVAGANGFDSIFHCSSQESCQISNSTGSNQIALTNNVTIEDLSTDCLGKLVGAASHPAANVVLPNELILERKFDVLGLHAESDKFNFNSSENTKKRPRVSKNTPTTVFKNVQNSKKNRQINFIGDEGESNIGSDGQSSSRSCSSEVVDVSQAVNRVATSDSKASQALNLKGKTRGIRGSATDPQSLYARKRRERINERLRILQNLVPNGTKVDISTMLEEAVQYVKFLQLQIKLLSSDDLWMYAPIAYNGIDIGLST